MTSDAPPIDDPIRCQACGEVIGVYEPMVLVTPTDARATSRAAEPERADAAVAYYHGGCKP